MYCMFCWTHVSSLSVFQRRLGDAAKKAIGKLTTRTVKKGDKVKTSVPSILLLGAEWMSSLLIRKGSVERQSDLNITLHSSIQGMGPGLDTWWTVGHRLFSWPPAGRDNRKVRSHRVVRGNQGRDESELTRKQLLADRQIMFQLTVVVITQLV